MNNKNFTRPDTLLKQIFQLSLIYCSVKMWKIFAFDFWENRQTPIFRPSEGKNKVVPRYVIYISLCIRVSSLIEPICKYPLVAPSPPLEP
jgi:hypothetical protein